MRYTNTIRHAREFYGNKFFILNVANVQINVCE